MLVVDLIAVGSFQLSLAFLGYFSVDVASKVFFTLVFEEDGESLDLSAP